MSVNTEPAGDGPPAPFASEADAAEAVPSAGQIGHAATVDAAMSTPAVPGAGLSPSAGAGHRRRWEALHYAVRNKKLLVGLAIELVFVVIAIFGPLLAPYGPAQTFLPALHPSRAHLFGTGFPPQYAYDIFSESLYGVRDSYLVGALGAAFAGVVGLVVGFAAGWRGGLVDELLQLMTNVLICIPQLVLLIVISAYLTTRGVVFEGIFIGVTGWPWVARAVRAQTFTLKARDFVDLARLSGRRAVSIVLKDIAPNMASYIFLVFVLLFASSMLIAVNFDFLGLGPTNSVSIGDMMNVANEWNALQLHLWWWFLPPGAFLALMVLGLLITNVGLDEVFNPKLRES